MSAAKILPALPGPAGAPAVKRPLLAVPVQRNIGIDERACKRFAEGLPYTLPGQIERIRAIELLELSPSRSTRMTQVGRLWV